jgi:hypothetical protein
MYQLCLVNTYLFFIPTIIYVRLFLIYIKFRNYISETFNLNI